MNLVYQAIKEEELLARFIVYRRWIRSDNSIRSEAFIPPASLELSVTRHLGLSQTVLWKIGNSVTSRRNLKLHGRADVHASVAIKLSLAVVSAPESDNPNHANITGWPKEKSEQKSLAQLIAAKAPFIPNL